MLSEGEEVDGLGEQGVEVRQGGELDGVFWVDGVRLVGVGSQFQGQGLRGHKGQSGLRDAFGWSIGGSWSRTPLTSRVPTRVMCPLTISFLWVLTTRVLPGSTGARRA